MQDERCTRRAERRLAALVAETAVIIQARNKGMKVLMTAGEYGGREALVDGVTMDERRGEWLFCCWILRMDGSGLLNTDAGSRSYHRETDFTPIERIAPNG